MSQPVYRLNDLPALLASGNLKVPLTQFKSGSNEPAVKDKTLFYNSNSVPREGLPQPKGRTVKPVRGNMNQLESDYAKHLDYRIRIGEVAAYWYEAIKFRLADGSHYTPDFLVMLADGLYQIHECKGHMREAAHVRLKVTSEVYWTFPVMLVKKARGVFTVTTVGR